MTNPFLNESMHDTCHAVKTATSADFNCVDAFGDPEQFTEGRAELALSGLDRWSAQNRTASARLSLWQSRGQTLFAPHAVTKA
uniref:hypothetical protein n=1 Tax=Pararhizobium sp. IMCC3301 TaxID=3067904 RepID=UPI0027412DF9|nr:hypothetical protein [Pararhizobium sp. IMCC3301]